MNQEVLTEASSLFMNDDTIHQDNHSLKEELVKFYHGEFELPIDHTFMAWDALPTPWGM